MAVYTMHVVHYMVQILVQSMEHEFDWDRLAYCIGPCINFAVGCFYVEIFFKDHEMYIQYVPLYVPFVSPPLSTLRKI